MKFSFTNLIQFLTTTLTLTLFLTLQAQAAAPFDTTMCNITNIVTGNAGKAFAAFAVISLGVGFFSGKISLGLLVASSIGISSMFAAPSMVSLLSGKDAYECEEGATYVTDCSVNGICYSCPAGHVGPNCLCPVGFTGTTCSECDAGYSPIDGTCKLDCTLPTIEGITETKVQNGTGILTCNTDSNYTGSINYSCNNNNFSITSGSCACIGNHAGPGCASCADGYQGEDCDECTVVGYTQLADGSCAKDCHVSGKPGIADGTPALPSSGSLTCLVPGYGGSINYSCVGGSFSSADNCAINSVCYQSGTHGTIYATAPAGHVWAGVAYAEYGAVSGCAANNSAVCSASPRSRDVKSFINSQCAGRNSCGIYVNEYIISPDSACNPNPGNNGSLNKLNFILYYY